MLWQELDIDIDAVPLEQLTTYTAVEYFLCCQSIPQNASPFQQVRHYLEAFHHLCDVQDWRRATTVLTVIPDTDTGEELHDQLGIWGYYDEQEKLYRAIAGKSNLRCDAVCYNGLGNLCDARGELDRSETYHRKHLEIAETLSDNSGRWMALMGLGNVESNRGNWRQAVAHYHRALEIIDGDPDGNYPHGRASVLGNLANLSSRERPRESLQMAREALEAFRQIDNPSLIARALILIGDIYNSSGQSDPAIAHHRDGLEYARLCNDAAAEIDAMKGLGEAHLREGNFPVARQWYERCYRKAKAIRERSLECQALGGLGMATYELEDYETSKGYFQTHLELASSMGDRLGMLGALRGLGYACDALNDLNAAVLWEGMALKLSEAMGEEAEAAKSHAYLGYAHLNIRDWEKAIAHLSAALAWQEQNGNPSELAATYHNLAVAYGDSGKMREARQLYQKGLNLARRYAPELVGTFRELRRNWGDDVG